MPRARPPRTAPDRAASATGGSTLAGWAAELVGRLERGEAACHAPAPWAGDAQADLVDRFGLDEVEQAILGLLLVLERDPTLTRRLRLWAATPCITVELIGALCAQARLDGAVLRLGPRGLLRTHALVRVPQAATRLVGAGDAIALEVGIEPPATFDAELEGVTVLEPAAEPAERAAYLKTLGGKIATVVALELVSAGTEAGVARAIADGTGRRVVAWASQPVEIEQARRLRRDVDRHGAILAVWGPMTAATLGTPPPARPVATPIIVALGAAVEERQVRAPFTLRRDKVAQDPQRAPLQPLTEMDRIRALAQRDAERALGIVRPEPPPRPVVPGKIVDTSVRLAPAPRPEPAPVPAAVAVAPPVAVVAPEPDAAPTSVAAPEPAAAPAPDPAAAGADSAAGDEPVPDVGRVEVAEDALPDLRAKIAMTSPSVAQRIELLNGLAGMKSNAVVAALRHNVKSENRALRTVAETLMAQLFGAGWNRSRPIPRPVQPPPSEE